MHAASSGDVKQAAGAVLGHWVTGSLAMPCIAPPLTWMLGSCSMRDRTAAQCPQTLPSNQVCSSSPHILPNQVCKQVMTCIPGTLSQTRCTLTNALEV